jgi:hypothetical protein
VKLRRVSVATLLAAWLSIGAHVARAQEHAAAGAIDGVVTDTSLVSLANATASILGSGVHVTTGANGRFRMLVVPAGHYILVLRHVGFVPVSAVVEVASGDTARLSIALEPAVVSLDAVTVTAEHSATRFPGFDDRRRFGFGHFVTQAEIEARNAMTVTDLLRPILSVTVKPRGMFTDIAYNMRGGGSCPFQVWVDDVAMPTPTNLYDLPSPKFLAGIEVYSGPATVPLQYKRHDSQCGVILIWTKDPG